MKLRELYVASDARGSGVILMTDSEGPSYEMYTWAEAFFCTPSGECRYEGFYAVPEDSITLQHILATAVHWLNDQAWMVSRNIPAPLFPDGQTAVQGHEQELFGLGLRHSEAFLEYIKEESATHAFDVVLANAMRLRKGIQARSDAE